MQPKLLGKHSETKTTWEARRNQNLSGIITNQKKKEEESAGYRTLRLNASEPSLLFHQNHRTEGLQTLMTKCYQNYATKCLCLRGAQ